MLTALQATWVLVEERLVTSMVSSRDLQVDMKQVLFPVRVFPMVDQSDALKLQDTALFTMLMSTSSQSAAH